LLQYITKCDWTSKKFTIIIWQVVLMGWELDTQLTRREPHTAQARV